MPQLNVHVRHVTVGESAPIAWVALEGFLDSSTVLLFENTVKRLAREGRGSIVLDFGAVLYANSTAIGTILNYRQLLREQGRELCIIKLSRDVQGVLDLLGVSTVVPCLRNEAAAEKYLLGAAAGKPDPRALAAERELAPRPTHPAPEPPARGRPLARRNVLMVAPEENRFTDIMKMRLLAPQGSFHIVASCSEALHHFDELDPDLIILEDPMHGSEDFLLAVKTEKGKSIVPVIKLYWTGTIIEARKDFKIWENDFLVEPFEVMELFALCEAELLRVPEDRRVLLHQTHFEFRTRKEHLQRANALAASLLGKSGIAPDAATAMAAALAEAIENAAHHGHQYAPEKCIDVVFLLDREKASFTVTDEGKGFDFAPRLQRAQESDGLPEERLRQSRGALGGIGISLMRRCTDTLEYLGHGNSVRLTRRLAATKV